MGKVLLHARVTPATGGCSDTMMLSCTALGYLNVHTDSTAATGSLSQNLLYLGSNAINLGSGAISTGTQRITIATNDSLTSAIKTAVELIDDAVLADAGTIGKGVLIQGAGSGGDAGKVKNLLTGEGTLGSGVLRVNLATDDDAVASLGILDNVVGTTGSAVPSGQAVVQVGGSDGTNLRTIKTGTDGVAHANITYIGSAAIPAAGGAAVSYGMPIHVSDGTYSRRTLGDSNGAQYVLPYTVPTFEDATNGWAETRPKSHYSACSADTATVTVDGTTEGTADELLASTNVSTYRGFTIWVENLGATAFSHVYVYASRDGTNWVCVDAIKNATELVAETLGATSNGIAFSVTDNPGWQYVKCTATVASGSTTATGAISYQM